MALAKKCDVCGNFFDIIKLPAYAIYKYVPPRDNKVKTGQWNELDICPECLQKLCDFIDNKTENKSTTINLQERKNG